MYESFSETPLEIALIVSIVGENPGVKEKSASSAAYGEI